MKITTRNLAHPNRDVALRTGLLEIGFSNVIDGRRVPSGPRMTISDPVTGESLAEVCDTQATGLNDAVEAAAAAFGNRHRAAISHIPTARLLLISRNNIY
jgi:hypothetical protein